MVLKKPNNSSLGGNHSLLAQQYSEEKPVRGEFPHNKKDVSTLQGPIKLLEWLEENTLESDC